MNYFKYLKIAAFFQHCSKRVTNCENVKFKNPVNIYNFLIKLWRCEN